MNAQDPSGAAVPGILYSVSNVYFAYVQARTKNGGHLRLYFIRFINVRAFVTAMDAVLITLTLKPLACVSPELNTMANRGPSLTT